KSSFNFCEWHIRARDTHQRATVRLTLALSRCELRTEYFNTSHSPESGAACLRCIRCFHSIPAASLSGVESFVGGAQESLAVERFLLALLRRSEPEAECDWKR